MIKQERALFDRPCMLLERDARTFLMIGTILIEGFQVGVGESQHVEKI